MRFPYLLLFLSLGACNQSGSGSPPAKPAAPAAYTYPAPVKGKYSEINSGKFDLVDGIANDANGGTIVYVTEKQIASPVLAESTCAMAQARSLALLRNSGYIQVRLNADGSASYFEAGTPFHGQMIDRAGRAVRVSGGKVKEGRVEGSVTEKGHAQFDFDLPATKREPPRVPTKDELFATYTKIRKAAIAKDLAALLFAQGFEAKQIEKIRGLAGIDADFAVHADRFMEPGAPEEATIEPGTIRVGGKGKNSKGAAFFNFYFFAPCGEKLVLVRVGENPQ